MRCLMRMVLNSNLSDVAVLQCQVVSGLIRTAIGDTHGSASIREVKKEAGDTENVLGYLLWSSAALKGNTSMIVLRQRAYMDLDPEGHTIRSAPGHPSSI